MMKIATALIQCMMRNGKGCSRCSWFVDLTAGIVSTTVLHSSLAKSRSGRDVAITAVSLKCENRFAPQSVVCGGTLRTALAVRKHGGFTTSRGAFDRDFQNEKSDGGNGFVCRAFAAGGCDGSGHDPADRHGRCEQTDADDRTYEPPVSTTGAGRRPRWIADAQRQRFDAWLCPAGGADFSRKSRADRRLQQMVWLVRLVHAPSCGA